MKVDYLIVGQGIAGTALSYTLLQQGKKVLVTDMPYAGSSSRVAGGVCNPITGRKLVKTWKADELFPFLKAFYQSLEKTLNTQFFYPRQIYRTFKSVEQRDQLLEKSVQNEWEHFFDTKVNDQLYEPFLDAPMGGWQTKQGGWLDTSKLLDAYCQYLQTLGSYRKVELVYDDVQVTPHKVLWKDVEATHLIFCQGMQGKHNPYFAQMPFRLVKGELLHIKIDQQPPLENVISQGVFMLPLSDAPGEYLVGATYEWRDLSTVPTEKAKAQLQEKLNKWLKLPYEILGQKAGVRPATLDRRPLVGLHPDYPAIGFFNGLGTKGVSLAPYFARHLVGHIEQGAPLNEEVDLMRYWEHPIDKS
ncbi:NAD(P)/FAD-dependent oxidoreductase [Microscilla marina]|uniref:FAD dependent oxidoreductase, putative n=1 Tax=Microscilla marina ATCC 23134 TaxID=313606 RepID=A1ZR82_MICM2|nr:FAD-dependent oxidoreductase [Microscilla marina]EAY27171.1 FAD dependent oxidoreductase, putative [Microscilla marina ATCC 23134]